MCLVFIWKYFRVWLKLGTPFQGKCPLEHTFKLLAPVFVSCGCFSYVNWGDVFSCSLYISQGPVPQRSNSGPINATVTQLSKLRTDLDIVEENVRVMNDMLTEISPDKEESDDITLLKASLLRLWPKIFRNAPFPWCSVVLDRGVNREGVTVELYKWFGRDFSDLDLTTT